MQFLEKIWKTLVKIEILNLSQQKEKETIWCQNHKNIITDDIYEDTADVETRSDTSNYELDRPLPKGKNKKVIGLMKDELGRKSRQNLLD